MRSVYGQTAEPLRSTRVALNAHNDTASGARSADTTHFRPDIEGLRAVAVLAVIAFHFGVPGAHAGFIGVDIFFVISGYLITGLLVRERQTTGEIALPSFYGRRMRRLLPALLLVTAVTLVCGTIIFSPFEQLEMAKAGAASAAYVSNFWFTLSTFGYFAPESRFNPFLHTWSLAVEEQFYIVYPALVLLVGRHDTKARIAVMLTLAATGSFALCIWLTKTSQPWAFFGSPARAWEFALGGLAVLATPRLRSAAPALSWIGVALLAASFVVIDENSDFPGAIDALPVAATALILMGGTAGAGRALAAAPLQWIGARSYSIYLWHWPVITFAKIMWPDLPLWLCAVCAAITLACASFSYTFVEHPIRTDRWLGARAARSLLLGAGATTAGLLLAAGVWFSAHLAAEVPAQAAIAAASQAEPIASGAHCMIGFDAATPKTCVFGDPKSAHTMVLFGDSHADEWSPPLAEIAKRRGWKLVTVLKSLCPAADVPVYNARLRRDSPDCAAWRAQAIAMIGTMHPDLVVISEYTRAYVIAANPGERPVTMAQWTDGLKRTIGRLVSSGASVVVLRDTPQPGMDAHFCLSRAAWHGQSTARCDTPAKTALLPDVANAERMAVDAGHARYADLTTQFCGPETCPAVKDTIVYRDGNHMTAPFAKELAKPLAAALFGPGRETASLK